MRLIARRLAGAVASALQFDPVVAITGPRSVGKTTLLRQLAIADDVRFLDLDDLALRAAVQDDPARYLDYSGLVIIDEYQHVPELLDAIKTRLNVDTAPGQFLLSGSSRQDALPRAAQSLTGRMSTFHLLPFSQAELLGQPECFLDAAFDDALGLDGPRAPTSRTDYIDRVVKGGMPLAVQRLVVHRDRWFDAYVQQVIQRDIQAIADVRLRDKLGDFFSLIAGQTGQILNVATAGNRIGVARSTAESYLALLRAVFLVQVVPAYGVTLNSRVARRPKVHVLDSGIAARVLGVDAGRLAAPDPAAQEQFGHLLETFVVGELGKQISFSLDAPELRHFRDHDGHEVDIVLQRRDGTIAAIEVKAGGRVRSQDLAALRYLRDKMGTRFAQGIVLTLGEQAYRTTEDRIVVCPIDRLWAPG